MNDIVVSVAIKKHLKVWQLTSRNLIEFIPSKRYIILVPSSELSLFKKFTPNEIEIIPEESVLEYKWKEKIRKRLIELKIDPCNVGWIYQQFLKLQASNLSTGEKIVIWDADTIPLKKWDFFKSDGSLNLFLNTDNHFPYFQAIQSFLGIDKQIGPSFVSQSIAFYKIILEEMISHIENKFNMNWMEAILLNITNDINSFSEYETLGSWTYHSRPKILNLKESEAYKWERCGSHIIGKPYLLKIFKNYLKKKEYYFISFEGNEFNKWKNKNPHKFLEFLLSESDSPRVLQIGNTEDRTDEYIRELLIRYSVKSYIVSASKSKKDLLRILYKGVNNVKLVFIDIADFHSKNNTNIRRLNIFNEKLLNEIFFKLKISFFYFLKSLYQFKKRINKNESYSYKYKKLVIEKEKNYLKYDSKNSFLSLLFDDLNLYKRDITLLFIEKQFSYSIIVENKFFKSLSCPFICFNKPDSIIENYFIKETLINCGYEPIKTGKFSIWVLENN